MIVAFSPEQAHEVSRAFDASWLMNAVLAEAACSKEDQQQDKDGTQPSKATPDDDGVDNSEKKSPAKNAKNKPCCHGPNNKKATMTFQPCRRYNQMARCAQRAANNNGKNIRAQAATTTTRIIVQRTPIHMDDATPERAKMSLDVTGFSPEDIAVSVDDYVVSVKGERTNKLGDVFVVDRKFRLDKKTAIVDAVTANFDGGILEVVVPKKVLAGPRTIPIAVTTPTTTTTPAEEQQDHSETAISAETVQEEDSKTDGEDEDDHDEEERAEAHSGCDDDADDVATDAWEEVVEE